MQMLESLTGEDGLPGRENCKGNSQAQWQVPIVDVLMRRMRPRGEDGWVTTPRAHSRHILEALFAVHRAVTEAHMDALCAGEQSRVRFRV